MLKVIKFFIYLAILIAIAYVGLRYFGYDINKNFLTESKEKCEEKYLKECPHDILNKGVLNADCNFDCVNPKIIIKKDK